MRDIEQYNIPHDLQHTAYKGFDHSNDEIHHPKHKSTLNGYKSALCCFENLYRFHGCCFFEFDVDLRVVGVSFLAASRLSDIFYASFGRIGRFVSGAFRCRGQEVQGFGKQIPRNLRDAGKIFLQTGRRDLVLPSRPRKHLCSCNVTTKRYVRLTQIWR